jgi:hypothetical protein
VIGTPTGVDRGNGPSWGREPAATHGQPRRPADKRHCSSTAVSAVIGPPCCVVQVITTGNRVPARCTAGVAARPLRGRSGMTTSPRMDGRVACAVCGPGPEAHSSPPQWRLHAVEMKQQTRERKPPQITSASEDVATAATPERTLEGEERRISVHARRGGRGHCAADHRRFTGADSPVMLPPPSLCSASAPVCPAGGPMATTITPIGIGGATMTLPAHAEHGRRGGRVTASSQSWS